MLFSRYAGDMHVLLTNDDGIDAPGLVALEEAVSDIATKITIVAPDKGYSGCGHQVTNHQPLRFEQQDTNRYKLFGTPADCARMGICVLAKDVDWVLAGVNDGGNLGVDLVMSGTVAAVREAAWLGKRAMAISQYARRERQRDWAKTASMGIRVLSAVFDEQLDAMEFWNVNLPDVETPAADIEMVDTFAEPAHLGVDFESLGVDTFQFRGDYRQRPRQDGSDVAVCFGGGISISRLSAKS